MIHYYSNPNHHYQRFLRSICEKKEAMEEPKAKRTKRDDDAPSSLYISKALDAITFTTVFNLSDLPPRGDPVRQFKADHVYQLFGDAGNIFGYRNLKIDIYYLACSGKSYVSMKYSAAASNPPPDDVVAKLHDWLPPNYTLNKKEYVQTVMQENHRMKFGKPIEQFQDSVTEYVQYLISYCDSNQAGFKEFHDRFQTYLVWFIEGANKIDVTDTRWKVFYVYEVRVVQGKEHFCPVGFCSVYEFYNHPHKTRPRISQCLILPPCQHRGLGTHVLSCIYRYYISTGAEDITVEDPCKAFTRMRDSLDCRMAMHLSAFSSEKVIGPFTKQMIKEAHGTFRFNKIQIRRIYEILHMIQILLTNDQKAMTAFIEKVKARYQAPYLRLTKSMEKKKCKLVYTQCEVNDSIKRDEDMVIGYADNHVRDIRLTAEYLIRKLGL